MINLVIHLTS